MRRSRHAAFFEKCIQRDERPSLLAVAHPRVMGAAIKGLFTAPSNPFVGGTEQRGLPADFLIDRKNVIVAARYGSHANEWTVDEVLNLARRAGGD